MRIMKKFAILIIITLLCCLFVGNATEPVEAATLVNMTNEDGTSVTFRNKTISAKQLSEYNYPTQQLRAVWVSVAVSDVPSYSSVSAFKSQHTTMLDNLEKWGMNALVYHIRTHNNALYKSELNPVATWWSGVNFNSFDPLEWLIEECHKRGIEFHAWMNPYRVSSGSDVSSYKSGTIPSVNPMNDTSNLLYATDSTTGATTGIILDPGIPSNRDFLVDTCMEVIENYDVDAIHFDDYFYIDGVDDSATRAIYNTSNMTTQNFRRAQVDLFIEQLSTEIRSYNAANNKAVQLGIAPTSAYSNGSYVASPTYDSNGNLKTPLYSNTAGAAHYDGYWCADTLKWINNEWIDYIMPQMYHGVNDTHSPFVEFTKWWSWAVAYKKVNFYAGIGMYMADAGEDSWNVNDNEFQMQLLNAGQYDQFKGACLYKYSVLVDSTHTAVTNAVDLITNDYWNKRIPGAVIQYYADSFGETLATNCKYSTSTSSVVYDAVEGVRGYVVWKTAKGTTLDMTNFDNMVEYTGGTSVVVTDVNNYDYYVSTVNLANEISSAVKVDFTATTESVRLLIQQLPETITYADKAAVDEITTLFNQLSNDDKRALGEDLQTYRSAAAIIAQYDAIIASMDTFIATLDTHINTDRILPVGDNMTWSYNTDSDVNIYNLETGVRTKDYLAVKLITLNLTGTDGTVSYTKQVQFNVGRLSQQQIGLFYRNDASCIGEYDEGSYSSSSSGYFGWSGVSLTIGTRVLFIAKDNYVEVTNASNIASAKHDTVGALYVNKTGSTLTIPSTAMFTSYANNYGYFIISSTGTIKSVASSISTSTTITLDANEAVMVPRYLDTTIRSTNMYPVTNLTVGTAATLTSYLESSEDLEPIKLSTKQELDTYVSSLSLTGVLLTSVENKVESYKTQIDSATSSNSISSIVSSAKDEISTYVTTIKNAQTTAINNVNTFVNGLTYNAAEKTVVQSNAQTVISNINNTIVEDDINSLYTNFVSSTQNNHNALVSAVNSAITELTGVIELSATVKQKEIITTTVNNAITIINTYATATEVNSYKTTKLTELNTLITDLKSAINSATTTIQSFTVTGADTQALITQYINLVNEAGSKEEVETLVNEFKSQYGILTGTSDYTSYRNNAKAEINSFIASLTYKQSELDAIEIKKTSVFVEIDTSTDITYLESIAITFKEQVESEHSLLEVQIISSTITLNSKECKTDEAKELVNETLVKVYNAGTLIELVTIMNNFENDFAEVNTKGCTNGTYIYINVFMTMMLCCSVAFLRKRK